MRALEEIRQNTRLKIGTISEDGLAGEIHIGTWTGTVVFSNGAGWEHVSVSPYAKRITPTWDDMCILKDIFFKDDEAVIQVHPAKKDYVNNMPNCLHLWRCTFTDMVLPPSFMVGLKEGQTVFDARQETEAYLRMIRERYGK